MAGYNKRRVKSESLGLDIMHIVIGIAVVVMAVITFLDPEENMILFPVIFLLAAVLNIFSGRFRFVQAQDNAQRVAPAVQIAFGLFFLIIAVISAISIWWR